MFKLAELYHPPEGQKHSNSVKQLWYEYEGVQALAKGLGSDVH